MTQNKQRDWLGQISLHYPKKWIIAVNVLEEVRDEILVGGQKRKLKDFSGEVYYVTDTKDEAWAIMDTLNSAYGEIRLVEGFDDTPQIGGLYIYE